jgi:hypothetical protein
MAGGEKDDEREPVKRITTLATGAAKQPGGTAVIPMPVKVNILLIPVENVMDPGSGMRAALKDRCDAIDKSFGAESRKRFDVEFKFDVLARSESETSNPKFRFEALDFPVYLVAVGDGSPGRASLDKVNKLAKARGIPTPFTAEEYSAADPGMTKTLVLGSPHKVTFVKYEVATNPRVCRGDPAMCLTHTIMHEVIHAAGIGPKVAAHYDKKPDYFPKAGKGYDQRHDPSGLLFPVLLPDAGDRPMLPEPDRGSDFLFNLIILAKRYPPNLPSPTRDRP